jgi:hypothetical protein
MAQQELKKGSFTEEEDLLIIKRVHEWGNKGLGLWSSLGKELNRVSKRVSERWRIISKRNNTTIVLNNLSQHINNNKKNSNEMQLTTTTTTAITNVLKNNDAETKISEKNNLKTEKYTEEEDHFIIQRVKTRLSRGPSFWIPLGKEMCRDEKSLAQRWRNVLSSRVSMGDENDNNENCDSVNGDNKQILEKNEMESVNKKSHSTVVVWTSEMVF